MLIQLQRIATTTALVLACISMAVAGRTTDRLIVTPQVDELRLLRTQVEALGPPVLIRHRLRLGERLANTVAEHMPLGDIDVVMPIPDSSRPAVTAVVSGESCTRQG